MLQDLDLSANGISDVGIQALAASLLLAHQQGEGEGGGGGGGASGMNTLHQQQQQQQEVDQGPAGGLPNLRVRGGGAEAAREEAEDWLADGGGLPGCLSVCLLCWWWCSL